MKAADRLFRTKSTGSQSQKIKLVILGLDAVARLQECFCLSEFKKACQTIIRIFGLSNITSETLLACQNLLSSKKTVEEIESQYFEADEKDDYIDFLEAPATLRANSKFYKMFCDLEDDERKASKLLSRYHIAHKINSH